MNYRVLFLGSIISLMFLFIELPELALIIFIATLFGTVYSFAKWKKKKVWEEIKNAEPTHPKEKMESYVKGVSKQTAKLVFPEKNTQIDYGKIITKSPKTAKNFFTELKELFK